MFVYVARKRAVALTHRAEACCPGCVPSQKRGPRAQNSLSLTVARKRAVALTHRAEACCPWCAHDKDPWAQEAPPSVCPT